MFNQKLAGVVSALVLAAVPAAMGQEPAHPETLAEIGARLSRETNEAYAASQFAFLSTDYFARFSRDPDAVPAAHETPLDDTWRMAIPADASFLTKTMADYLDDFLSRRMGVKLQQITTPTDGAKVLTLEESGGGDDAVQESFTISVSPTGVAVRGRDANGLRDGIVKLVDRMGMRQAPYLIQGETVYRPRLAVRLGSMPMQGSHRELIFMGYNAVFAGGGSLFALSTSEAIPEIVYRQVPGALEQTREAVRKAKHFGLKAYATLDMRQKFPSNHPVFAAHPDLRGSLTWSDDGEYVLCTEHPLMKQWLTESIDGLFGAVPDLDGIEMIVGGESFYHCFMRPHPLVKGHTNCARCEALGAETVVSNLINLMVDAAHRHNPRAEVIAWPYSAEHTWSADKAQVGFIEKLKPGAALFSEMEKSEFVEKPEGFKKSLWDYSIDLIGPGERAKAQIEACTRVGIPIYMKSEPELGFEAPRLPHIPCLDRWIDRAEAMASCGATGAWVFPAFRPFYGTSAGECYKLVWWDPVPDKEALLQAFAARIAGHDAGPHLRQAWRLVSEAIPLQPELPSYYNGPYYLGPAHPMCADPGAELPQVFYGKYLFLAEMSDKEGLPSRPTFVTSPTGSVPIFGKLYRRMEDLLGRAVAEIETAAPKVPARCRLTFEAEASPIRWFYATARTEANFYEACPIRDRLTALASKGDLTDAEREEAAELYNRWRAILSDELDNTRAALPVVEADMRLDFYYGGDHTFPHAADMIRAKLAILEQELKDYLPGLASRYRLPQD